MSDEKGYFTKFGVAYRQKVINNSSIPYFLHYRELNSIIEALIGDNEIKITLEYADGDYISLRCDSVFINYSIRDKALVPDTLVIKDKGIKKKDIKRSLKKAGKGLKAISDTLRVASGGIRIDAKSKIDEKPTTLKVGRSKKIRQIT